MREREMPRDPGAHIYEPLQKTLRLWLSVASLTEIRSLLELVQAELNRRGIPFDFTLPEGDRPGGQEGGARGS